jgi:tRNA U34 5-carboxymethylaminomethyl modifying enzyme MnmG/GidA
MKYFMEKLSGINYRISIHEENANRRLASEAINIALLPKNDVPKKFKAKFAELIELIENTYKKMIPGLNPTKLGNIQNRTAARYIKLLIDMQSYIDDYM